MCMLVQTPVDVERDEEIFMRYYAIRGKWGLAQLRMTCMHVSAHRVSKRAEKGVQVVD
jgi:hypothetical protein